MHAPVYNNHTFSGPILLQLVRSWYIPSFYKFLSNLEIKRSWYCFFTYFSILLVLKSKRFGQIIWPVDNRTCLLNICPPLHALFSLTFCRMNVLGLITRLSGKFIRLSKEIKSSWSGKRSTYKKKQE